MSSQPGSALSSLQPGMELATGRFLVRRMIGQGGMGVVYEAADRQRGTVVAIKVVTGEHGAAVERLKAEFRSLADVVHPNLVRLHELFVEGDSGYFTMELVRGDPFTAFVCEDASIGFEQTVALDAGDTDSSETVRAPAGVSPSPNRGRFRERALRSAFNDLVSGVRAIHAAGKLHRDLKPSNVLVTRAGRVVILDFGLASDRFGSDASAAEGVVSGTPAYMAPEQAAALGATTASDYYALGVMLYEALTGELPFSGSVRDLLHAKQTRDPPRPAQQVQYTPPDLDALCMDLLQRAPAARPGPDEIVARLGTAPARVAPDRAPDPLLEIFVGREQELEVLAEAVRAVAAGETAWGRKAPFVGRSTHLAQLQEAFERTRAGHAVALYLGGRSGMGKTALASEFVDGLARSGEALVLAGRCYERESVPFKALDTVVDALASHLKGLPRAAAAGLLPRGIHDLGRVFPALRQVEAISDVPQRTFDISDDGERRRRAFAALKELLSRLVDKGPLVVFIDDLQWGDVDSARLLVEILGPPDPPALLLLGTYRTEEEGSSPLLAELFRPDDRDVRRLEVPPLTGPEACDLARALMNEDALDADRQASTVAGESEGSPFFVVELVRHLGSRGGDAPVPERSSMSLEQVLRSRCDRLGVDARQLLEVISVAGGPLEQGVAARASDLEGDPMMALAELRAGHLVRTRGTRETDEVETYHDRIRETVARHLDPKRVVHCHLRLAVELEASGRADPEVLAAHFLAVGRGEEAGRYALAGAEQAADALAFDKAARLYRRALDLGAGGDARRRELRTKLGGALVKSGRGREAAVAFLSAAEGASSDEAIALKHSAAEQFLISGHVDLGMDLLRDVLRSVDLPLPGTPRRALVLLLSRRARLAVRGLKFRPRDAAELPASRLRQIDICYSAALGLSVVDWIYGASFQALQLLLALSAGEPSRIALGLAFEAGHVGCSGGPTRRRTLELVEAAESLTAKLDNPEAEGFTRLMKGVAEWGVGRFRTGLECTTDAERILRERCTGVSWQIDTAQVFSMICMTALGDLRELSERHPVWVKEARERGDLYATTSLRTFWGSGTLLSLAAHDPDRARADIDDAMQRWSRQGYHPQHYYALMSHTLVDLYVGDGAGAFRRVTEAWSALSGSLLLRVQALSITAFYLRASAALAAATGTADREPLLRSALRDAATLTKTQVAWSIPLAHSIQASVAVLRGDEATARPLLEGAAIGFDAAHMALHAAVARRALGVFVGGEAGRGITETAEQVFSLQKITRPGRFSSMLAPGLPSQ